ncbi:MAG: thioesterase family protein [Actinomycetota bacterium]|nr:thioesterase family protein [Actinomycetota bacterium]MDA3012636.1 thioesterase family protein [Actinomycetota bacterium]MDA3025607.1 thioesterase family protein [Actinomycetota bacterium]
MVIHGDYEFDRALAMERRSDFTFDGAVAPGWDILGNANGGYLIALAARAMSEVTGRPDCFTVTAHYLAPAPVSASRVEVRPVRAGRRFATATSSLFLVDEPGGTGGRECLRAIATMGDLSSDPGGPTTMVGSRPDITPWDECPTISDTTINEFAFIHGRLGTRIDPRDAVFRTGAPSGEGVMRGWFAFRDDRPIDSLALLLACDAFPPAAFNLDLPTNWVPTVELTVHVRAIPAPGPVACFFRTRFVQNGLLEVDGEVWDAAGTLVAQSRQLALAPRA